MQGDNWAADPSVAAPTGSESQEVLFYQNLFSLVAQNGAAPADAAGELFRKSGLAEPVLHAIWGLSDTTNSGYLDFSAFCTACRLIAHAQNGLLPSHEAAMQEPPSLPFLDLSAAEQPPVNPTGRMNDYMEPPPVAPLPMPPGDPYVDQTSVPPNSGGYQKWFMDLDQDQDGFLTGDEVRMFFQDSALGDDVLFEIWNSADQDMDGLLNFQEFSIFCDLVNNRLGGGGDGFHTTFAGAALGDPSGGGGLSNQNAFGQMEPAFDQSFSRNLNPDDLGGGGFASNEQQQQFAAESGEVPTADPWGGFGEEQQPADASAIDLAAPSTANRSGGAKKRKKKGKGSGGGGVTDASEPERADSPEEKKKTDKVTFFDDVSVGDLLAAGDLPKAADKKSSHLAESEIPDDVYRSSRLDEQATSAKLAASRAVLAEDDDLLTQIRKKLQMSVDIDYEDVRNLLLHIEKMRKAKGKEEKELREVLERKEKFQKEIEELRFELEILKEERRHLDETRVCARKDCDSMAELVSFYHREIEDMRKDIQALEEHSEWLKAALLSTRQQTEAMQAARRTALEQSQEEERKIADLETQITELRVTAERTRRELESKRSERLILEQHFTDADQDRYLMVSGLEQQRAKLERLRAERLSRMEDKQRLTESAAALDRWSPMMPQHHTNPQLNIQQPRVYRDKKGVPNSAASSVYGGGGMRETDARLEIAGSRGQWETFSSDKSRRIAAAADETRGTRLISVGDKSSAAGMWAGHSNLGGDAP